MLLPPQTASVASELAVLIHNPMAGNHDRDPVSSIGMANCPLTGHGSDAACELFVRTRFPVWNAEQFVPNRHLKRRSRINQRNRKLLKLASEIRFELLSQL